MTLMFWIVNYLVMKTILACKNFLLFWFINRGKNGQYFVAKIEDPSVAYAYVGCRVETFKSRIIQVSLDEPIVYQFDVLGSGGNCSIYD